MKAIDRVMKYIDYKGIKPMGFEQLNGFSNGYIGTQYKRKGSLGEDKLNIILENCLEINPIWLLTGKGSMLKEGIEQNIVSESSPAYGLLEKKETRVPLVYQSAVAGFGNNDFAIKDEDVKDTYVIPIFKHSKVDFMIEVKGDSMYPKYNSGDVVACTIINEAGFIQWNKAHLIATRGQGLIVKRLHKAEDDTLKMVSDNEKYPPFEVHKDEITGIALIIGVVRLD